MNGATAALLLWTSLAADIGAEKLWATWRLVSFTRTITATGETTDVFGKEPHGFIAYGRDGRMVLFLKPGEPGPGQDVEKTTEAQRARFFNPLAYDGTYTFDGRTVSHRIDFSAKGWTGLDHVRYEVKFEGNRLVLTTTPGPSFFDGKVGVETLTFEKVAR